MMTGMSDRRGCSCLVKVEHTCKIQHKAGYNHVQITSTNINAGLSFQNWYNLLVYIFLGVKIYAKEGKYSVQ